MNKKIFETISKFSIYSIVFSAPLFFLPFSQDFLGFPKHLLLVFLLAVGSIGYFFDRLFSGKTPFRGEKMLYIALIVILFSSFVSSALSLWKNNSFFGNPLDIADSFSAIFAFVVFVFLFIQLFADKKNALFALKLILISFSASAALAILQLHRIFILPIDFVKAVAFNTVGSINSVAILSAIFFPISIAFLFHRSQGKKWIFCLTTFILLLSIILIGFKTAWFLLVFSAFIIFLFGVRKFQGKSDFYWMAALMTITVISIFFLFFPLRPKIFPAIPVEVSPSFSSEVDILKGSFGEGAKNVFFGSGPGTFVFNYSKFRSEAINLSIFWNNRFLSGNASFFDWIITRGILGLGSMVFLICLLVFSAFRIFVKKISPQDDNKIDIAFFSSAAGLIILTLFYAFNFVLWFIFWFFAALIFSLRANENYKAKSLGGPFQPGKLKKLLPRVFNPAIAAAMIAILSVSLFFIQSTRYMADANYFEGTIALQSGNFSRAIDLTKKAFELNPSHDLYGRDLGQLHLARANEISGDVKITDQKEKETLIYQEIAKGVEAIGNAVNIGPFNVANWNVRGFFYRNLIGIDSANKAGELAIDSYKKAIELEPNSPFAYGEIGRVYILIGQNFEKQKLDEEKNEAFSFAIENLNRAIELKPDYAPAHYLMAVVYDQQGKIEEAIKKLGVAKNIAAHDAGIAFQRGLLFWRKNEYREAKKDFERAIELNPEFSNARYMLGLVLDKIGSKLEALNHFKRIEELNPENQEIKKIIENLNEGLPALWGINESQETMEENPPEIQTQ